MKKRIIFLSILFFIIASFSLAMAVEHGPVEHEVVEHGIGEHEAAAHVEPGLKIGMSLPLWSAIPFLGILLSIALFPLFAPRWWHHHFGKVSAFWAIITVVPFIIVYKHAGLHETLHIYIGDYFPFIVLLWGLFTVAGGIYLRGTLLGTPSVNTCMIGIGTALASWMGTTGAAMLLIRPFLRANRYRKYRTFMVVFFIFLVANIGGALTPVGDPPLFLGFLHGVPFFWTFKILPHMLFVVVILLGIYFLMDLYYYKKEKKEGILKVPSGEHEPLGLSGWDNFILLAALVGSVIMSGVVKWGEINVLGVHRTVQEWARDLIIIALGIISIIVTPKKVREDNEFTWFPIKEVAYLFAGIFMCMAPCLLILKAGEHGVAAPLIKAIKAPAHYFWITGSLSAFLDNAPTYLTFFSSALGKFYAGLPEPQAVPGLLTENAIYLKAISAGAVFFGANTYIGNAPNFMVRSISEEAGTPMPSFFGYMLKYSCTILLPIFVLVTLIFFP